MSGEMPDQEKLKATGLRYRWLILVGVVIGMVPASFGAIGLYHSVKVWRAHSLVRAATKLQSQESNSAEVESKLIAAYHLMPEDTEVLRACAHWELVSGNPHALGFYQLLLAGGKATREDERDALRGCLLFGNLQTAHELAALLTSKDAGAEDYALEAQVRWQEHAPEAAISLARHALSMDEQNRAHQFLLSQMLASLSDEKDQAEAIHSMQMLAGGTDQVGLKALVLLSTASGLDVSTQQWVLDRLHQYPLVEDEGRLAAWGLERRLGQRDAQVIGREVIDFFKATDITRKTAAARWLYSQGQPELAMELASPPDTQTSQNLLMIRLDSLAYLKRWIDLQKELADPQIPLSQPIVFLYRARAARELGDAVGSHANWDRARAAASMDYAELSSLVEYALKLGAYDEAKLTLKQMIQFPEKGLTAYTGLLQLEAQHGESKELLETLRQMMAAYPDQPEPKNDWAYLSLLLNTNVDEAWKTAQNLVEAHSDMLAYRSTLALACVRRNDLPGAEKVYEGVNIDWNGAPASWRMVYAVVLAADGHKAQAQDLARGIDRGQLRSDETALLNTYFPGT